MKSRVLLFCLALLVCAPSFNLLAQSPLSGQRLGQFPLVFEPNRGQAPKNVHFLSRTSAYTVLLQSGESTLVIPAERDASNHGKTPETAAVTIELLHSNKEARAEGLDLLQGKSNYFIGKETANWIRGISQYGKVAFRSIYPGIDVVYYGSEGKLEYDFILAPGADPRMLSFRVKGAEKIQLDSFGCLSLQVAGGTIELRRPTVYQESGGAKHLVEGNFVWRGGDEVGLNIGEYNSSEPLVVDPVLSYSTLIGANANTQVQGVAVDPEGNVYIAGTTFATNYPTVNAFQATNKGTTNVFITKLSPGGNVILYSTYLGGSAFDTGRAIAVDSSGSAYVTGNIGSGDFPTTPGAFMTTCAGVCNTPFVTKILTDGSLAYSTYMGGSNVAASAIAVDSAGAAYITGSAASNDLPLVNPFQTTPAGVFAQKLNPEGSGLAYSTYLGGYLGGSGDSGQGIAVDTLGSAYVVGQTAASNFPLKNPLQSSYVGLAFGPNAFMTKFSPDGSFLIYSTYLGGSSPFLSSTGDVATGVAVDHFGNAHVTGSSSSCDFPLTLDAFSTDCTTSGDQKIFALTLNSTGNQMLFSTFLRSGSGGSPPQIAVDQNGNSYVAGTTTATDLPVINAIETRSNGGFITELDLSGKLLFSTYLGGVIGGSVPVGIGLDGKGGIYVAGFGQGDFPLLHPLASQVKPVPGNVLQIFAAKIVSKNAPQFSLSPRVSPFLTLQNVSSVPLTINSIVPSTNFTMGGDCGSSLAPGTGCDLILEGAADNKSSGTVTISTNAYAVPQKFVIWKAPKGDSVGPLITISPTGVQFPAQLIGTTSAAQQVVIKNMGLQQAAINSISMILPSAFTETNNCPALLNPADSCTVSITYKAATVQDSAQIAVLHDPNQTRDTISLGGDGSASAIAVSTSSVGFGSQSTGAAPLGRIVNLTNTTPYPAAVTSVSASANFAQTNTCSAPLAPQASCRAAVTFVPSGNQDATGTLTAANFGPGGPQTVNLSGTGRSAGDLGVDPPQLSFVSSVGFESILGTINLTNNSQKMISISSIQVFSPFLETNTCPGSLAPGGSCQISVGFKPKQVGPFSGALKVTFAGNGSPQVVGLTGQANTEVHFDPSPVLFGEQRLNVAAPGGVNIVNLGAKTFSLGSVTVQGSEFALAKNNCGPTLMQDRVCGLELAFTPAGTGIRTGTITLMAGDAPIPHVAMLQGIGISNGQGTLSAASLEFGSQTIGTQSNPQTVKLKNNGSGALQLGGIVTSPQFTQTNTCGSFLAAKAQCTISIRFAPTLPGMLVGSLSVQDDGAGSPHTLALNGISQ